MLTALFVQIIIMSAALGIINHKPQSTNPHNSDSTVGILDALLRRMYAKNSKPYGSNVTELFGRKYEELLRKPLRELLEGEMGEPSGQKKQDAVEKSPLQIELRTNALAKPVELKKNNGSDSESSVLYKNDEQSMNNEETFKESLGKKVRDSTKENLERTFTENHQKNLNERTQEKVNESSKLDVEDKQDFKESRKLSKGDSKKNQPESFEENFKENLRENKQRNKENKHQNGMRNHLTEQKLKDLEQILRYFTQLIEQDPGYISRAKSAKTNSTNEATKSNATNNITEEISQPDLVDSTPSLNLISNLTDDITSHWQAHSSDLNWYKPTSKNLSQLVQQADTLPINNSDNFATTDQNIELFQNFFSYHKIPYPVLSLYPLLANRSQIVSFTNATAHSSKNKRKHSWIHSGPSNTSSHDKNALLDPFSKPQYQPEELTKLKTGNESCLLFVNTTKAAKASILSTTIKSVIPIKTKTQAELVKIPPLPKLDSHSEMNPADLLHKCWIALNKTRSEIGLHEDQKPDAITCIIPRQNTSIFYGHTPEPMSKAKSGFYKFFNKKEKKKKVISHQPTSPSPITEMKTHTGPTTQPNSKPTVISTQKTLQATDSKNDDPDHENENEIMNEKELYNEGINKILEDISSKMCLPNMINSLLELVCQNVTMNSSLGPEHPLCMANEVHERHNHYHSHYNHSATKLGANDSKKRWTNQHHGAKRDNLRFKSYSSLDNHKTQESTYKKPNMDNKASQRDLSELLFLIGMNKDESIKESDIKSNLHFKNNNVDVAYVKV